MTTRRTETRHDTEAAAEARAERYRRELRGYDPITRVLHDPERGQWVLELTINESCD